MKTLERIRTWASSKYNSYYADGKEPGVFITLCKLLPLTIILLASNWFIELNTNKQEDDL